MIWECPVFGSFVATSERYLKIDYNPETNDTQFRALVEWCISKYIHTEPHAGGEMAFMSCLYEFGDMKWNVFANTLVDCMILAVLAHRGDSDDRN